MQLTPRYLVNNRTLVISNEVGFVTEYNQVYQRELQVYRGIDNTLQFQILNADQKPVHLGTRVVEFVAFDSNKNLVISHSATTIIANKGLVAVTISDNDLLNIQQQYLHYNLYIVNDDDTRTLTYTDEHFDAAAVIYINANAYPGPKASIEISNFNKVSGDNTEYVSDAITAEPGINGNEALHTAAIYATNYVGEVIIEATLENQVAAQDGVVWTEIDRIAFDGTETQPVPVNYDGVISWVRFRTTDVPDEKIEKILVRN